MADNPLEKQVDLSDGTKIMVKDIRRAEVEDRVAKSANQMRFMPDAPPGHRWSDDSLLKGKTLAYEVYKPSNEALAAEADGAVGVDFPPLPKIPEV
jgi:hypothetical protein